MIQIHQGIDMVEIPRFKKVFLRNKDFVSDIFTDREREYCLSTKEPYIHFAGRFAAKEAALKALGAGIRAGIDHIFREIEIIPHSSGKPLLSFSGWAEKICKRLRLSQFTVSISHSANYAVATVILVGDKTI